MELSSELRHSRLRARVLLLCGAALFAAGSVIAQEVGDVPAGPWFHFHRSPSLSVVYGGANYSINGIGTALAPAGLVELKLGGVKEDLMDEGGLIEYRYEYFTIANISNDLGRDLRSGELATDTWRVGFAWEKGYGYQLGEAESRPALILYKADGILWSRVDFRGTLSGFPDGPLLGQFEDAARFGTKTEAGVRLRLLPLVVLDAGFERSVTFRRHIFWPWIGSVAVEGAGQWLLDRFVSRILDSTPAAVPVVNFVLKSALAFGAYQLRREKMFAPFESEPPLFSQGFKAGVTLIF